MSSFKENFNSETETNNDEFETDNIPDSATRIYKSIFISKEFEEIYYSNTVLKDENGTPFRLKLIEKKNDL